MRKLSCIHSDKEFFSTLLRQARKRIALLSLILTCLAILVVITLYYKELYQEDSYTHYLMAKYAWKHSWLFLDIWGRPIPTTVLSFVAPFGLLPTKVLTIFISLLCVLITYRIARAERLRYSEYIIPFLIFQPYYLLLSVNPLTEIIFATILTISLLFLIHKNYLISTIICSLLPMVRPEGFFFLIFWMTILIYIKKWKIILLLGLGIFLWNFLGFLQSGDIVWLYNNFPWFGQRGFYGSGSIFHFIFLLPEITGILLPLFLIGLAYLLTQKKLLFPVIFLFFFILHTILWKFGFYKSGGYARYFVAIAPIIAIISLWGFEFLDYIFKLPKITLAVFTIFFSLFSFFKIFEIQNPALDTDHLLIANAYQYYRENIPSDSPLICASNYFFHIANVDRFDYNRYPFPCSENIDNANKNTVVIWDSKFFAKECGISREMIINLSYKKVASFISQNPFYNVVIFIKP